MKRGSRGRDRCLGMEAGGLRRFDRLAWKLLVSLVERKNRVRQHPEDHPTEHPAQPGLFHRQHRRAGPGHGLLHPDLPVAQG